jgi:hypothetical protein
MVRLDRLAERFLQSVRIIILTSTENVVKRFHLRSLDRRDAGKELPQNITTFPTTAKRAAKLASINHRFDRRVARSTARQ